ncbi:hypothetical protein [Paractinoplanes lichenicola]|uniref:Uncharacterized protein n=1 Tax=Paractinoplanes lichenicola TaxID=2802976 RepID=A0ABS1W1A1_9ACTN|nr:hypothetical protein [Actinoplanes lichenicola]MBL7260484.1 hypothetical protein [Actinoplanes lichenicola]
MSDGGEDEHVGRGRAWNYWWLRRPWWARGAVAGLLFGVLMFVISWARDDDPDPAGQIIGALVSAVLFAVGMGLFIRVHERRLFQDDGRVLTPEERIAVVRSVDVGRWPRDARLHPFVSRLVDQRLSRALAPAVEVAVFVLMLAVAVVNVVLNGPWWWLAVAFWLAVGPLSMRSTRRSRAAARALREVGQPGEQDEGLGRL